MELSRDYFGSREDGIWNKYVLYWGFANIYQRVNNETWFCWNWNCYEKCSLLHSFNQDYIYFNTFYILLKSAFGCFYDGHSNIWWYEQCRSDKHSNKRWQSKASSWLSVLQTNDPPDSWSLCQLVPGTLNPLKDYFCCTSSLVT